MKLKKHLEDLYLSKVRVHFILRKIDLKFLQELSKSTGHSMSFFVREAIAIAAKPLKKKAQKWKINWTH